MKVPSHKNHLRWPRLLQKMKRGTQVAPSKTVEESTQSHTEQTASSRLARQQMDDLRQVISRGDGARHSKEYRDGASALDPVLERRRALGQIRVVAFVGPSGTGKSTRALELAKSLQIHYLIDDGLLIHGSRILAGSSAKKATTRMESVRQAIFVDESRAENMRRALARSQPEKLLILGTSDGMLSKICTNLWLKPPVRTVRIDDIASEAEQRAAKTARLEGGHHTIPVPSLEIKHEFSGYLSNPFAAIRRGVDRGLDRGREWAGNLNPDNEVIPPGDGLIDPQDRTVVRPTFSSIGRYRISDEALESLIRLIVMETEGVQQVSRIHLLIERLGVVIQLDLTLLYGYHSEQVLTQVQQHVARKLEALTSLNVLSVHVRATRLALES